MSKTLINLKDLDDLLCKYQVKDLKDLENRFVQVDEIRADERKKVCDEIRAKFKNAKFELRLIGKDGYDYTDNFLYQIERGENA